MHSSRPPSIGGGGAPGGGAAPSGQQQQQPLLPLQLQLLQQQQQGPWLQQHQLQAQAAGIPVSQPLAAQTAFLPAHGLSAASIQMILHAMQAAPRSPAIQQPSTAVLVRPAGMLPGGQQTAGQQLDHSAARAASSTSSLQALKLQVELAQHAARAVAAAAAAAAQPGAAGSTTTSPAGPRSHGATHDAAAAAAVHKRLTVARMALECCSADGLDSASNSVATTPTGAAAAAAASTAANTSAMAAHPASPVSAAGTEGTHPVGGAAGAASDAPPSDPALMAATAVTAAAAQAGEAVPGGGPGHDTFAVISGALRGWYSNCRGRILPVHLSKQQREAQAPGQPGATLLAHRDPSTAAEDEWLPRATFVRMAGFKTLKHGADSVINLLQPDGAKGITLMALFRRIKRQQQRLENQMQGYGVSDTSELYSTSRATAEHDSPEASSAAAVAGVCDWHGASASGSQLESSNQALPDVVLVSCNGTNGWYSSSRDKVLPQEEQQQQRTQVTLNLSDEPHDAPAASAAASYGQQVTPATAPESAWLSRSAFVKLAGLAGSDISGTAIKLLQADGSLGATLSTFVRFRADSRMQQQLAANRRSSRLSVMKLATDFFVGEPLLTAPSAAAAAGGSMQEADYAAAAAAEAGAAGGEADQLATDDWTELGGHDEAGYGGVAVEVMCGPVRGWYSSARDRILPERRLQQQQHDNAAAPLSEQEQVALIAAAPDSGWVSKTAFMKLAPQHCWKCDSNKAIKLLADDGSTGLTLGTFIKHERRRMYDRRHQQDTPTPQTQTLAAPADEAAMPPLLLQPLQQRPAGSDAAAAAARFRQQHPDSPWSSDAAALDGGGAGGDSTGAASDADTDTGGRRASVRKQLAMGGGGATSSGPAASAGGQQLGTSTIVPVICGSAIGWYSLPRDLVLPLTLKQERPGWQLGAPELAGVPEGHWVSKLVFKKLGGMQHQHDALKSIKLAQADGSIGITLATHLKRERELSQRRAQEELAATCSGGTPYADTRMRSQRRKVHTAAALESSSGDFCYETGDTPDPEYRPSKKVRRKTGGATSTLHTEAQLAARAEAARKRALAFIAAAVAAAAAAAGDESWGPDAAADGGANDQHDGAQAAAAAGQPMGDRVAAAAAAAGGAAADAAEVVDGCLESDPDSDIVVPVVCGAVRGWYSSSRDQVLLQPQPQQSSASLMAQLQQLKQESETDAEESCAGEDWPAGSTSDGEGAPQQQQQQQQQAPLLPPSELLSLPGSSLLWLSKRAFKKLGGMQHKLDAFKALRVLQPDGNQGATLGTHLRRERAQRQQPAQSQQEEQQQELQPQPGQLRRQHQEQQAWLDALLAATDAMGASDDGDDAVECHQPAGDAAVPMDATNALAWAAAEQQQAEAERPAGSSGVPQAAPVVPSLAHIATAAAGAAGLASSSGCRAEDASRKRAAEDGTPGGCDESDGKRQKQSAGVPACHQRGGAGSSSSSYDAGYDAVSV